MTLELQDVPPSFTVDDAADKCGVYAEGAGDSLEPLPACSPKPNIQHIGFTEFRRGLPGSAPDQVGARLRHMALTVRRAALLQHIVGIVPIGPQPEMGWVDARRVVAGMADKQAIGDWAYKSLIREAMSKNAFPVKPLTPFPRPPVAVSVLCTGPHPAKHRIARIRDVTQHPFGNGHHGTINSAGGTTIQ